MVTEQSGVSKFTSLTAVLAVFTGAMVLVGWGLDIGILKSILPIWVSMKANTAVCFILIGLAMLLTVRLSATSKPQRAIIYLRLSRLFCLLAGLIGLLSLSEYLFDWNPGFDQWLFVEPAGTVGTSSPGRMAPETALDFVLLALALWISCARKNLRTVLVPIFIGLLVAAFALASLLSRATPGHGVYGWFGLTTMAVHTAILFMMLGVAVMAANWQSKFWSWSLSRRSTTLFASGIVALMYIGTYTNGSQFRLNEIKHKSDLIKGIQSNIKSLLAEVERAQYHAYGYIITGAEQFKAQYLEANTNSIVLLNALRVLTSGDPHHQQHLARIEERVNAELLWLQQNLEVERTDISAAARNKMIIHGEAMLENLQSTVDQIEREHSKLIQKLEREYENVSRFSYHVIFTGTLFSLLMFLLVIFRINLALNKRLRVELALRESEEKFRLLYESSRDAIMLRIRMKVSWVATGRLSKYSAAMTSRNSSPCHLLRHPRNSSRMAAGLLTRRRK